MLFSYPISQLLFSSATRQVTTLANNQTSPSRSSTSSKTSSQLQKTGRSSLLPTLPGSSQRVAHSPSRPTDSSPSTRSTPTLAAASTYHPAHAPPYSANPRLSQRRGAPRGPRRRSGGHTAIPARGAAPPGLDVESAHPDGADDAAIHLDQPARPPRRRPDLAERRGVEQVEETRVSARVGSEAGVAGLCSSPLDLKQYLPVV
jgi:hypothetical protein